MEFWGVEVKSGETVKVDPEEFDAYVHLSQAALGESKQDSGSEKVVLHLKVGDQKLVLGTLSRENFPQLSFDIVLDKEFELSHNWKNGSVYLCGYKAEVPDLRDGTEEDDFDDESDDDEDLPMISQDNGKLDTKTEVGDGKFKKSAAKGPSLNQVKVADSKKDEEHDSEDDDSDDDDSDEDDGGSSEEDMMDADSDGDESDSDEDDEETPKKASQGKKRPNDSATKTPIPSKKAKAATPQKTDGKKGGHTDTPHPKKGIKTPNSDSKSGGKFSCKSCSKSFNSEAGLQQHSKAKHA